MEQAKYSALQIAKYFIKKSSEDKSKTSLTSLKLQKILYYAQGWYLANFKKPLFRDEIQAWKYGPAIRLIYDAYTKYGTTSIVEKVENEELSTIEDQDKEFLNEVWSVYKNYSATDLVESTHNEMPWREARKDISEGENSEIGIPLSTLEEYFSSLKQAT